MTTVKNTIKDSVRNAYNEFFKPLKTVFSNKDDWKDFYKREKGFVWLFGSYIVFLIFTVVAIQASTLFINYANEHEKVYQGDNWVADFRGEGWRFKYTFDKK